MEFQDGIIRTPDVDEGMHQARLDELSQFPSMRERVPQATGAVAIEAAHPDIDTSSEHTAPQIVSVSEQ